MRQKGTIEGKQFEFIFEKIARLRGFLARKIPLSARIIGQGRVLPIKSELDYILLHPDRPAAFIDTKTFQDDRFSYSMLNRHQVELAFRYNNWGQPAGFVVWFRKSNTVVFFSGKAIVKQGARTSFGPENGIILGKVPEFNLNEIFTTQV